MSRPSSSSLASGESLPGPGTKAPGAGDHASGPAPGGDALSDFHPAVRRWFSDTFERPTPAQVRGWEAIRSGRHALISAPTGSGKTLAAFLGSLDRLLREGVEGGLPDETRVVYVSPLKALSQDVHRNLQEPRRGIAAAARNVGLEPPEITAAVRTGDTPRSERRRMVKTPPHVLVTTPESLYLLLTAERSREMLRSAESVIVDEIHAVIESRRGAHLALSLERLREVAGGGLQRIGLSATQRPIREVGRFLVGAEGVDPGGEPECRIVDEGHEQEMELALELPGSPLESVLSGEAREEIYDRLAGLVRDHRTTIVFVNTRREAERVARGLAERLGEEEVTAHHGSLSKETRHRSERRLAAGELKALVATASMELGIDVGYVELACQLGSPHRITSYLQRVGRSGHTVAGTPRGRLFPLTRDDLVECAALLWWARRGELDRVEPLDAPLDILSQQIVAAAACREWDEEELYALCRRAWPYRELEREAFDEVVRTLSRGVSTRRGRRGARIHHDAVNGRIRGRKGARLAALTCGGAIPDNADYRVLKEPEGTYLGTLNEDFAVESLPGDVVQLGNTSWRILRVETGVVRVEDARGEPPNIPFWLGEAPARSRELSKAVSELRAGVDRCLGEVGPSDGLDREAAAAWLRDEVGLGDAAAFQVTEYLAESKRLLGDLPTRDTLVLERFFDEAGGMQVVVHSPFGSRLNRAWGLALRKRFCRRFNFELQAAATEEGVLLSLGPQHSFPAEDVFRYLHPDSVRDVLVQAVLDAPVFQTRWRWNATLSLALLRWRGGSKVAPQIQRMEAEDLLSAVFPDANACLENIAGDREVPDHFLVRQTLGDCLGEAMDLPGLREVLRRIHGGEVELVARDTPEPSPLSHEVVNARPYAYLDDAPLEERRARAVRTRRAMEPSAAKEMGALDGEAIRRVREEARPRASGPDEVHDALLTCGFLLEGEIEREGTAGAVALPEPEGDDGSWAETLAALSEEGRAARARPPGGPAVWVAAERLPEARLAWPEAEVEPAGVEAPAGASAEPESREEALKELVAGRLSVLGPVTEGRLGVQAGLEESEVERTMLALEEEGRVLRGRFTPEVEEREWCDRRLLARIHRYTLKRLRAEIRPVSAADFTRFLFRWQRALPGRRVEGSEGVAAVLEQLEGVEAPAAAWEADVLALRCDDYEPDHLDRLCAAGRVAWGRLTPPSGEGSSLRSSGPLRTTPVSLWARDRTDEWLRLAPRPESVELSTEAREVAGLLAERGAVFFRELVSGTGLLPTRAEQALGELAAFGLVTSDSFVGLRALVTPADRRGAVGGADEDRRKGSAPYGVDGAGRWSLLREPPGGGGEGAESDGDEAGRGRRGRRAGRGYGEPAPEAETFARVLLRRYGVVFRRLLDAEAHAPPWRELVLVYRRLEARGEIRGGRFVAGFSGEQFALPEAVGTLREVRREDPDGELVVVSAADPLNLTGIVGPGDRVPAVAANRVAYRDGRAAFALEGGEVRPLAADGEEAGTGNGVPAAVERALVIRQVPPELRAYARTR